MSTDSVKAMMKLLLTVFLALSLANQLTPLHSEPETIPVLACVPGQTNQVLCFSSEFDDDQRLVRTLQVTFVALPFALTPPVASRCPNDHPIEFFSDGLPLYKLNAVLLI